MSTFGSGEDDALYIRPADGASIVSTSAVYGGPDGAMTTISKTRSQSWSTTIEMSLGIADILSLGLSLSSTFEESVSDSESIQWAIPAGETGYVVFTAYMMCSTGSGTCNGKRVEGEVCTPCTQTNGKMAGEFSVVLQG
ncbi:hypothetical protein PG996_000029 [Apiospora saccharicola]|uniref:Uncharacterized protein n=1 Tax=Apiospora saccharicola TaxID=335842 RepID=A0ABR1WCV2_9PEZI